MTARFTITLILVLCGRSLWAQPSHCPMPAITDSHQKIRQLSRTTETVTNHRLTKSNKALAEAMVQAGHAVMAQPVNGIDELTFAKMRADGVPINVLCDDGTYLRRTALLLTGRLPDPDLVRTYYAESAANRRNLLVDHLLRSEAFNIYWGWWFQELFESNGQVLRGGLNAYSEYFETAVAESKALDDMARELITATGPSTENGPANFYIRAGQMTRLNQDFWDNSAAHAVDKFLGVPALCISCHDGAYHLESVNLYLADRKREDLWGMAAFFSGVVRRPIREDGQVLGANVVARSSDGYLADTDSGDRPARDGGMVAPAYMFTGETPPANQSWPEAFATMITTDRQFARNFANRLWGHLFGLAMVEPVDGFDLARLEPDAELPGDWEPQVLNRELLEHMTDHLIATDYDLRSYLHYVVTSATFQMDSTFPLASWQESYAPYYTRFLARHMTAEMVYDSLATATGITVPIPQGQPGAQVRISVDYAHEMNDTTGPRGPQQTDLFQFLQAFGRGNRLDIPRTNQGSITQALVLMNSPVVTTRLSAPESRLFDYVAQGLDAEQIVAELYLDLYCESPSAAETEAVLAELAAFEQPIDKATTALWLLLNRVAFTFIY